MAQRPYPLPEKSSGAAKNRNDTGETRRSRSLVSRSNEDQKNSQDMRHAGRPPSGRLSREEIMMSPRLTSPRRASMERRSESHQPSSGLSRSESLKERRPSSGEYKCRPSSGSSHAMLEVQPLRGKSHSQNRSCDRTRDKTASTDKNKEKSSSRKTDKTRPNASTKMNNIEHTETRQRDTDRQRTPSRDNTRNKDQNSRCHGQKENNSTPTSKHRDHKDGKKRSDKPEQKDCQVDTLNTKEKNNNHIMEKGPESPKKEHVRKSKLCSKDVPQIKGVDIDEESQLKTGLSEPVTAKGAAGRLAAEESPWEERSRSPYLSDEESCMMREITKLTM